MSANTKKNHLDISLFIPVYNEERVLESHVMKILREMRRLHRSFELIIIDDNSTDKTYAIARRLSKRCKEVYCLHYDDGPSRRENLGRSFPKAKGNIISFMDVDLAVDLKFIKQLFEEIDKGADISVGSRYLPGAYIQRTLLRKVISYFYNKSIRIYLNSKVLDHQCGFKAFRRDVALRLTKEMAYDHKFIRGWFWDAELLIRAQRQGYDIVEFPVLWKHGQKSEFNFKRELKLIPYLIRLRSALKKGKRKTGKNSGKTYPKKIRSTHTARRR